MFVCPITGALVVLYLLIRTLTAALLKLLLRLSLLFRD